MAVEHTTFLEMLGKDVSFTHQHKVELTDKSFVTFSEHLSGTVTNIVLSLSSGPDISINDGDFYSLSDLLDFKIL